MRLKWQIAPGVVLIPVPLFRALHEFLSSLPHAQVRGLVEGMEQAASQAHQQVQPKHAAPLLSA